MPDHRLSKLNGPVPASAVEAESEKTEEQLRQERAVAAVRARQAKREALRRSGADVAPSSSDLAGRIEHGLKKREKAVQADHRARAAVTRASAQMAVRAMLADKGVGS
jgi:hypothetical protein